MVLVLKTRREDRALAESSPGPLKVSSSSGSGLPLDVVTWL
jgi:hypothetical protein